MSQTSIDIIGLAAAIAVPLIALVFFLYARRDARLRSESRQRMYTAETEGEVVDVVMNNTARAPEAIKVRYTVDGTEYTLRERVRLKAREPEAGQFIFNTRKTEMLDFDGVGSRVRVRYQPDNPVNAYLPDNEGLMER